MQLLLRNSNSNNPFKMEINRIYQILHLLHYLLVVVDIKLINQQQHNQRIILNFRFKIQEQPQPVHLTESQCEIRASIQARTQLLLLQVQLQLHKIIINLKIQLL